MLNFKAAIFDMDGTILNSYHAWEDAFCVTLKEHGIIISKDEFIELYKMTDAQTKEFLAEKANICGVNLSGEAIYSILFHAMEYQYAHHILPKAGVLDFMKALHEKEIPLCVATLTHHTLAQKVLQRIGAMQYINFIITGDIVGKSKEFPDIYIQASKQLGYAVEETAVFEDSLTAAKTAHQAGFIVYGVFDEHQTYDFPEIFAHSAARIYDWVEYYASIHDLSEI